MSVRIETARLLLRPIEAGDRPAWVEAFTENDRHWGPWGPRPEPGRTLDERFEESLAKCREGLERGTSLRLTALERARPGAIVGFCSLNNVVRGVFQNADMGWMIAARAEGMGLAGEMVRAMLDHAFTPEPAGLGLHRVQANVIPGNDRSLRLAERVGFRREGVGVRMLMIDGRWQDHVMHAIVADEWPRRAGG